MECVGILMYNCYTITIHASDQSYFGGGFLSKNWEERIGWRDEELQYFPKRKVNNHLSWKIHHVMGSFYSNKMARTIGYESMGECLFYFFLELTGQVERYYVQPVEVEVPFLNKEGDRDSWTHVPDVLVFGEKLKPTLYQIKETPKESKRHVLINKACERYSLERDWNYKVIYPKKLPKSILYNIKFLQGFIRKRKNYEKWIPEIKWIVNTKLDNFFKVFKFVQNRAFII